MENSTEIQFSPNMAKLQIQCLQANYCTASMEELQYRENVLATTFFVAHEVLIPMIAIVGILGNLVTIVVFSKESRCSTNMYLTSLAVSDSIFLIFRGSLSRYFVPNTDGIENWAYYYFCKFAVWLSAAAIYTSNWLTVSLTIERFIQIAYPLMGKSFCTRTKAKITIGCNYLLCFLLTFPRVFEFEVQFHEKDEDRIVLGTSELRKNKTYTAVVYWFNCVVFLLTPLLLLAVFNFLLIREVRRSFRIRPTLTEETNQSNYHAQQHKITVVLIAIVLLAIICQFPDAVLYLLFSFRSDDPLTAYGFRMKVFSQVCMVLITVNAGANFILYSTLNDRYRKTFMKIFWYKRCDRLKKLTTDCLWYVSPPCIREQYTMESRDSTPHTSSTNVV